MRFDIRVLLLSGLLLFGQSLASASILTFDACGGSATAAILNSCFGGAINQGYGDRVTGLGTDAGGTQDRSYGNGGEGFTPNILTSYNTGFGWDTGFGTLANVMYVDGITAVLNMTFSADAGFRAQILGFSLGAFLPPSGGYNGVNVSVRDQSNSLLFNQTYNVGATDINQLLNVQSSLGGSLTLLATAGT